jgi:MerR family copper efflux transcriptional regulator
MTDTMAPLTPYYGTDRIVENPKRFLGEAMAKRRTIGKLAAEVGVNVETVRFYERAGILEQPSRRDQGWREYDDERLVTLQYVREARRLGLTVADIGHLHEQSRGPQAGFCESVRDTVAKRIEIIDARIADLVRTRAGLVEWLGACRARSAADRCPTYAALNASREPDSTKS